jgi:hypothetical protein
MSDDAQDPAVPEPDQPGGLVVDRTRRICGANTSHGPCRSPMVMRNGRCKNHGGAVPRGIASPHFKTGKTSRYLKHMPDYFRPGYIEAQKAREEIVSLVDMLCLTDARITDTLQRMRDGDLANGTYRRLQHQWSELIRTQSSGDTAGAQQALNAIGRLIESGAKRADFDRFLDTQIKIRARLVAVESKRQHQQQELVAREQFGMFVKAVLMAVAREGGLDAAAKGRIQETVLRLLALASELSPAKA